MVLSSLLFSSLTPGAAEPQGPAHRFDQEVKRALHLNCLSVPSTPLRSCWLEYAPVSSTMDVTMSAGVTSNAGLYTGDSSGAQRMLPNEPVTPRTSVGTRCSM